MVNLEEDHEKLTIPGAMMTGQEASSCFASSMRRAGGELSAVKQSKNQLPSSIRRHHICRMQSSWGDRRFTLESVKKIKFPGGIG